MEKQKFECLKDLASLENCIDCVRNDIAQLTDIIRDYDIKGHEEEMKGAEIRGEHLTYWLEQVIQNI